MSYQNEFIYGIKRKINYYYSNHISDEETWAFDYKCLISKTNNLSFGSNFLIKFSKDDFESKRLCQFKLEGHFFISIFY